jgi:hypothetical protein
MKRALPLTLQLETKSQAATEGSSTKIDQGTDTYVILQQVRKLKPLWPFSCFVALCCPRRSSLLLSVSVFFDGCQLDEMKFYSSNTNFNLFHFLEILYNQFHQDETISFSLHKFT